MRGEATRRSLPVFAVFESGRRKPLAENQGTVMPLQSQLMSGSPGSLPAVLTT